MRNLTRRHAAATALVLMAVAGCGGGGGASRHRPIPQGPTATTLSPDQYKAALSHPVEDSAYPQTSNPEVDSLHYGLVLGWDPERRVLTGKETLIFRAAESVGRIRLDLASAMHVTSVTLDGSAVGHQQSRDGLVVATGPLSSGSDHVAVIAYDGTPRPTAAPSTRSDQGAGLGWSTEPDGTVYTFQEPYGAYTWYAVNDHPSDKAFYDVTITTPARWQGVFNGQLVSSATSGQVRINTWHLDSPAASYLTTIAIGPYRQYKDTGPGGLPISYWVMDKDRGELPLLRRDSRKAIGWLVAHLGPHPFSTLGVVIVGGQSAMETQSLITMSAGALQRPDAVLAHEYAHSWYGDSVGPSDWKALWLNEGFAMYVQGWFEQSTGHYQYAGGIDHWRALDQRFRDEAGPPGEPDPRQFASANVYICPALMLDAIRKRIGDRRFEAMMRAWPADHAYSDQNRASFVRWLNQFTGRNLTPLVNRWLDSPTTPR